MQQTARWLAISLLALVLPSLAQARPVTVFAASSMTHAIDEIITLYQQQTGNPVLASYAASSSLARQIAAGAPADIYISANQRWMDYLQQQGALLSGTRQPLTGNRLVLVGRHPDAEFRFSQLPDRLRQERLAIADPAHVPAGIYARQALEGLNLWQAVHRRLANSANVRAALLLVERGEAPLGIVYQTDALLSQHTHLVATIPSELHTPIIYPVARIKDSLPESAGLLQFLTGPIAAEIFIRHGFTQPQPEVSDAQ